MVRVGTGAYTFEWQDEWAHPPTASTGWAHPGVAVTQAGEIITCDPGQADLHVFDASGTLVRTLRTSLTEGHGITAVHEHGSDYVWIADSGSKRDPNLGYEPPQPRQNGRVVKMTMEGTVVAQIDAPDHPAYRDGVFSPTSVAINEERYGGNGDVWVADGYGQNLVHRYYRFDKHGEYRGTLSGGEGADAGFATPHGLWFDRRRGEPELYVADRSNRRIQVFDADGHFKRMFGQDVLNSPSAFARLDDEVLVVAELRARLALLDSDDQLICYLGADDAASDRPGWPNARDEAGQPIRPAGIVPGKFNSPHGLAADPAGNVYVAEWLIGGRYTRLHRAGGAM